MVIKSLSFLFILILGVACAPEDSASRKMSVVSGGEGQTKQYHVKLSSQGYLNLLNYNNNEVGACHYKEYLETQEKQKETFSVFTEFSDEDECYLGRINLSQNYFIQKVLAQRYSGVPLSLLEQILLPQKKKFARCNGYISQFYNWGLDVGGLVEAWVNEQLDAFYPGVISSEQNYIELSEVYIDLKRRHQRIFQRSLDDDWIDFFKGSAPLFLEELSQDLQQQFRSIFIGLNEPNSQEWLCSQWLLERSKSQWLRLVGFKGLNGTEGNFKVVPKGNKSKPQQGNYYFETVEYKGVVTASFKEKVKAVSGKSYEELIFEERDGDSLKTNKLDLSMTYFGSRAYLQSLELLWSFFLFSYEKSKHGFTDLSLGKTIFGQESQTWVNQLKKDSLLLTFWAMSDLVKQNLSQEVKPSLFVMKQKGDSDQKEKSVIEVVSMSQAVKLSLSILTFMKKIIHQLVRI